MAGYEFMPMRTVQAGFSNDPGGRKRSEISQVLGNGVKA